MATFRVGVGSFNIKDGSVGIGTEGSGHGNLKVEGTIKSTNLDVLGVSTFTRYSGFNADDVSVSNRTLNLNTEYSSIGDIVVDDDATIIVGSAGTVCVGSVECVSVKHHFSVPVGDTAQRDETSGYAEGTVRFNRDLGTMEFFNGSEWRQFRYQSDTGNYQSGTGNRGRGICCGGETSKIEINYFNIQTRGNAKDFGDLTAARGNAGAVSSGIRGIIAGGEPATDLIQYFTIASQGNAIDFDGNLTANRRFVTGCSSSTRGLFMGGSEPTRVNKVEYIEMASAGVDAADFGDLTEAKDSGGGGAWSNGIRGGVMGGYPNTTTIEVLTIASKGNASKFGNTLGEGHNIAATSNSVRAIGGGGNPSSLYSTIQYITMASDGNATYFGDLSLGRSGANACSSGTRSVLSGGNDGTNPRVNTMDYVEIATTGNAIDFGDLNYKPQSPSALSDCHGGLGGY